MPRHGEVEERRKRMVDALDARIAGGSYRQIARKMGVSEKSAYYYVQDELARLDAIKLKKAEKLRELECERLDRSTLVLMAKLGKTDLDVQDAARAALALVRIAERRAKLLGLDAPEARPTDLPPLNFTLTIARPPQQLAAAPELPVLDVEPSGNGKPFLDLTPKGNGERP